MVAPRMLFAPSPYARPNQLHPAGDRHADDGRVGVAAREVGEAGALEGGEQLAGFDARADGDPPGARSIVIVSRARVRSSNRPPWRRPRRGRPAAR